MPDYGLLTGLAEGLKSGINSYRDESDRQQRLQEKIDERKRQKLRDQASLGEKGLLQNSETGAVVADTASPVYQQQQFKDQAELAKSGLIKSPEGKVLKSPEAQAKDDLERRYKEQQIKSLQSTADNNRQKLDQGKDPTAEQFKAAGFTKRIEQAEQAFDDLTASGYNRADRKQGLLSMLPTTFQGENSKLQDQAERNFINAVLRRESGAAISPSEFTSAQSQYLPRAGDTPDVLAQKKANREQVKESLKAEGSRAYAKIPTVPVPKRGLVESGKAPAIGTVENGYEFLGGDPGDPKAWRKK